ncbi:MAG: DALR domain-containing protein, partial [Terriglobia bacterium]
IFPHHENEIAQSEGATGKPFARFWVHAEHLIVNGEKMSKSLGNFYTLRDLIAKGYHPSAIRYLLASVPYSKPLNFTFDGLVQAQKSIERLRNFEYRLKNEKFPAGENPAIGERSRQARKAFEDALDNNLNTAEALAAVFGLVSDGNTAMDHGEFHNGDREGAMDTLDRWDRVFRVLADDDHEKLVAHHLVNAVGAASEMPPTSDSDDGSGSLVMISDEEIERQIALRKAARTSGNYAESDRIRDELFKTGVILEDTKAGTRWKRK